MHSVFSFKSIMKVIMAPTYLKKPLNPSSEFIDRCIIPTVKSKLKLKDYHDFFNPDHIDYYSRIAYTEDIDIYLAICKREYYLEKPEKMFIGDILYNSIITTDLPQWYNMTGKDPYLHDKKIFIISTKYLNYITKLDDSIDYIAQLMRKIVLTVNPKKYIESSVLYDVPIIDENDYFKLAALYVAYGVISNRTDIDYDIYKESTYAQSKFKSSDDMEYFMKTLDREFLQDTQLRTNYF